MDRAVHGTTRARGGSRTALASGISASTAAVAAHRPHRRRPHKRNGAEARLPPPRFAREARPMQRILVVEDDMQIARTLRDYLEVAGFDVTLVGDGSAALAGARGDKPDLIVLDLGLPSLDGLDVARELRRTSAVPIVMLTARGEEADRSSGSSSAPTITSSSPSARRSWWRASGRCCGARTAPSPASRCCGRPTSTST